MFSWLFKRRKQTEEKNVVVVYSLDIGAQFTFPIYIILDCQDAEHVRNSIEGTRLGIDAAGGIIARELLDSCCLVRTESLLSALNPDWRARGASQYPPAKQMALAEFELMLKELTK